MPAAAPSRAELHVLTERVALRVMTRQRGTFENFKDDAGEPEGPAEPAAPRVDEAVTRHGFNLHASLTIAAEDDLGRESLCR